MLGRGWRLPFRPFGVPIELDPTFALVLPLFAWLIGSQVPAYAELLAGVGVVLDAEPLTRGATPWLLGEPREGVAALVLTASGGPFRESPDDLSAVTPEQALAHPTWRMGPKVTIDSATLFNKGLEVLEAAYLFRLPLERIEVVVHPQSLVHALVRFHDGSIKAQIGPHDMRLPIQYALHAPARPPVPLAPLPLEGTWTFHRPDLVRFPALAAAYAAGRAGGDAPVRLNAADEVAVDAFLSGRLPFTGIARVLDDALEHADRAAPGWDDLATVDADARARAREAVARAVGSGT